MTRHARLQGDRGPGVERAMRIIVGLARASGATRLIPIGRAHIDGVLYHGQASQDFADWFTSVEARVAVPTTLNVAALDLLHPWLFRGDEVEASAGRRLVDGYLAMGCLPTMTCAPYQERDRPGLGEDVAWAESNAIVFVNSVLGARTARYGDFSDIAAAVAGWVPDAGLHRPEARLARLVVELDPDTEPWLTEESGAGALGVIVGRLAAGRVAAIVGLPADTTEDALKALGAGAASSGSVAMFHAVGLTPEAPTLEAAVGDLARNRIASGSTSPPSGRRWRVSRPSRTARSTRSRSGPRTSPSAEFERLRAFLSDVGRAAPGGADREHLALGPGRDHRARLARRARRRPGSSSSRTPAPT